MHIQSQSGGAFDLLKMPGVGRFLRWRHSSTAMRLPLLIVAVVMIVHGLAGPALSPKNLATVLTWLHFRGLLVLGLLLAGNWFCMACPFMLVRNAVRRLWGRDWSPRFVWPKRLRSKWLAILLFVAVLFVYELADLWAEPAWTAGFILSYFVVAVGFGLLFRGAPFCNHLCPLGQFSLVSSLVSPLEVRVRDQSVCAACTTHECVRGCGDQPGCELGLFQPKKVGNMNCHFRLDCLRACPYDNVGIMGRLPASELWVDPWRSVIGRFSERPDMAALVIVYTFGALLNAFGMVTPVYELQAWLAGVLHTTWELPILGIIFLVGLALIPLALLSATGALARRMSRRPISLARIVTRYAYALAPLGFGIWVAHFSFHFMTGALTIVPVVQDMARSLGMAGGRPRWDLGPIVPGGWLFPLEVGFMGLGWLGSLLVAYKLAEEDAPARPWSALLPWAGLLLALLMMGIWLMSLPMEMRGTFLDG
jgi:hypothetical protein